MLLVPDPAAAFIDPFLRVPTLVDQLLREGPGHRRDVLARPARDRPQGRAASARRPGSPTTSYWGPECEFYIFDSIRFDQNAHEGYYHIDSVAGIWNSGAEEGGHNLGYKPRHKEGYFPLPADGPLPGPAHARWC